MAKIFEGIKVLDLGWALAGPAVATQLACFGALVVEVESGKHPSVARTSPPFKDSKPDINRAGYYAFYNPNKYSICIDLAHPKGAEVVKRLVAWADIVVANFASGVMERLGLDYKNLKQVRPDIILLCSTNQGESGPHAKQPGFGHHLVALGGICHFTGWPDREPVSPGTPYTDMLSIPLSTACLVAALIYRRRTGQGQKIDFSQLEASLFFLAPVLVDYTANNRDFGRRGNYCSYASPHGVYRCKGEDSWCAITVFTDVQWENMCQVINSGWTREPRFQTLLGRKHFEEELDELIQAWTANLLADDVVNMLQAVGVPAGIVKKPSDIYSDPELTYRNNLCQLQHAELGVFTHLGHPFKMSKTPAEVNMPAPCLGEHTAYVCQEILHMPDEEFAKLIASGVFE